jgi:hypothetical protein
MEDISKLYYTIKWRTINVSLEMQVGENCENTIHSFIILNVILKDDGVNDQVLLIFQKSKC